MRRGNWFPLLTNSFIWCIFVRDTLRNGLRLFLCLGLRVCLRLVVILLRKLVSSLLRISSFFVLSALIFFLCFSQGLNWVMRRHAFFILFDIFRALTYLLSLSFGLNWDLWGGLRLVENLSQLEELVCSMLRRGHWVLWVAGRWLFFQRRFHVITLKWDYLVLLLVQCWNIRLV